jgi:hypothetical protein
MTTWTDTDFININSGGDYTNHLQFPGSHSWDTSTPGQINDTGSYNQIAFRTATPCASNDQYVEFQVDDLTKSFEVCVRAPATSPTLFDGYWARVSPSGGQWWKATAYAGGLASHAYTGAGTIRLQVSADVVTLYINGNLVDTIDHSGAPITSNDDVVGFGVNGNGIIYYAAGGDTDPVPDPDVPLLNQPHTLNVYRM